MGRRIATLLGPALLAIVAVVVVRALTLEPAPGPIAPDDPGAAVEVDIESIAARLSAAIAVRTISTADAAPDPLSLDELRGVLEAAFPRAHEALAREIVGDGSVLYTWPGRHPGLPPLLLLAHLDVVAVPRDSEERWSEPPFAGRIARGYVWGRGAMDDKAAVVAILAAVESLVEAGHRPERTILLAFGHDEERGGEEGAKRIAALLERRGVRPALVLDEGYAVLEGLVPGVERPVAAVGVAEKGYLSVELVARSEGGHSSIPPAETAVALVARAIERLLADRPEAAIDGPVRAFFDRVAPAMGFGHRLVFANLWLFSPLVERVLSRDPGTNALVRTTTAPTMLQGSEKDNVLPAEARAVVNFRVHPRDTIAGVLDHVRETVDDPRIEVRPFGTFRSPPGETSSAEGPAWEILGGSIRRAFPDAVVAPSLVVGGTDARHYAGIASATYRFLPLPLAEGDLERIHGVDERIALGDLARMVVFYSDLVRRAGAAAWSE